MPNNRIYFWLSLIVFVFSTTLSLQAEDEPNNLSGKLLFGYRFIDTSGTVERYKQDINLDEGLRIFNFNLQISPHETLENLFDRININMYNFGGDPYETFRLAIQKSGRYKFQYDRRKSTYFYADQHEVGGHLFNPFTFDFDRIMDNMFVRLYVNKNFDVYANFDRYSKEGDSVITLDLNRIEFEFDKPIQEDFRQIAIGINLHMEKGSFVFEEKITDYTNTNSLFLPGFADGGSNARYPSTLNLFTLNQPYDLKTNTHTFKVTARPLDKLFIKGYAQISNQDMDLSYSEEVDGVNYLGKFFEYGLSGDGKFDRNIQNYDLDITYILLDKLALIGAFRFQDFEQDGFLTVDSTRQESMLKYKNRALEGGLQYQFSPDLAITAGYRNEVRNLDGIETITYEEQTTRNGLFGNLKWNISRASRITADYQLGTYDNPYTLISLTSFHRFRFTAKTKIQKFNFSGSYLWNKTENKVYDTLWNSRKHQITLRTGYHGAKIQVFGGYSYIDVQHAGDRIIAYPPAWSGSGTFPWEIFYEGKSSLLDASLSADLVDNWRLGGYANLYWNRGFWEIDRFTIRGYVEYTLDNGLITQLGYRYIDFEESLSGFNDYSAHIFEISFGYVWK